MRRAQWAGMIAVVVVSSIGGNAALGQVTLDHAWSENPRTLGGGFGDWAHSIQPTTDGGYVVAGYTKSFGAGEDDVYLIKLDSGGNLDPAWPENPRTFGGDEEDSAFSIRQTSDGGYIVAGGTTSFGAGQEDVYLIKVDSDGNLDPAWDPNPKIFGGERADEAYSVRQTTDGGYIVAGITYSFGDPQGDVYLIKVDSTGNLDPAWNANPRTFGGDVPDWANSVEQTPDGGYVVAGWTFSLDAGSYVVYLIKLDAAGNLDPAWDANPRTFGGEVGEEAYAYASSVRLTSDGGYIVAGSRGQDLYVIRLDAQGHLDPAWDPNPRTFEGEGIRYAGSIQPTTDGGYIVVGGTLSSQQDSDVYLIKLDAHGNFDPAWYPNPKTFGGEDNDRAESVQETADGGYVVAGGTRSFGADSRDVLIVKLAPAHHFLRGDCNGDGETEGTADALDLLTANFLGDVEIPCLAACDANGDGKTGGVADALELLTNNFLGGVTIPAPFPACGAGQLWTDGPLGCDTELECN